MAYPKAAAAAAAILLLLVAAVAADHGDEFRIHEGATLHTQLTASPELKRKLDRVSNCYSTLDTDVPWIELKDGTNTLWTSEVVNFVNTQYAREQMEGTLTMMCPGNKVISLSFSVHITKQNRHAPTFKYPSQEINVPLGSPVGALLTQLEVTDHDAVIYNAQRTLSFKSGGNSMADSLFSIQSDGSINLKANIPPSEAYKRMEMQVVAVDYGSPQRYSETNITIIPVTVSQVRNLRVNVASDKYQILEWEAPEYGVPEKYRLVIRKDDHVLADEEVDAKTTRAMTRVKMHKDWKVTYSVAAVSFMGETPSPKEPLQIRHSNLECSGECSTRGGLPLCFYGPLNTLQQYEDAAGRRHCDCFPGYTGTACEHKEACPSEKRVESFGGLDWPETSVNLTANLFCPYNDKHDRITRSCEWNAAEGRAQWARTHDSQKCQTQSSILLHLAMLAGYADNSDSISKVTTISNYVSRLLTVPSFATSGPAHFDLKIAQYMAFVLDTATRVNYTALQARTRENVTEVKMEVLARIASLSSRLPVPFQLASEMQDRRSNLSFNVVHWLPGTEHFRQAVGEECYVQLPMIDDENVLRAVCMTNSSLVSGIDHRNPVLTMHVDTPAALSFSKITFGLRTFNTSENYTCVYYDEIERAWSNRGIKRIAQKDGMVECETSHLSTFSLLPESTFAASSSILRDLAVILPTVTSFIAIVCGVFLLFLAAIQRGPSIDYPLLVFLFLAFIIHALHLLTLLAPQLGDPFLQAPTLHLVYQFCVIAACALVMLLAQSIYAVILSFKCNDDKPEPPLCSSFCSTLFFGIIIPALLTSTTYFFAQQNRHELTRVFTRLDWLFILNFLSPSLIFCALTIVFCFSSLRAASNCSSRTAAHSLSLSPASHSAAYLLVLLVFLIAHVVLFVFRAHGEGMIAALFVVCQLIYCLVSFVFAGFLFRLRYMQLNGDELSTRSVETKSRAVLSHVDRRDDEPDCSALLHSPHNPSDDLSCSSFGVNGSCKGGRGNGGASLNASSYYPPHPHHSQVIVRSIKSTSTPSPPPLLLDSPTGGFSMTASLFERTPMVSIV